VAEFKKGRGKVSQNISICCFRRILKLRRKQREGLINYD